MKRFKGLTEGLWRVCGIRIAVPLLMEHDVYKVFALTNKSNFLARLFLIMKTFYYGKCAGQVNNNPFAV